jgi:hypothetical protein
MAGRPRAAHCQCSRIQLAAAPHDFIHTNISNGSPFILDGPSKTKGVSRTDSHSPDRRY